MREGCERTLVPYSVPRRTAYHNNRENENSQKNPRPPCFKYWPEEFKIELLQARSFRAEVFEAAPIAVFWEAVERLLAPFCANSATAVTKCLFLMLQSPERNNHSTHKLKMLRRWANG